MFSCHFWQNVAEEIFVFLTVQAVMEYSHSLMTEETENLFVVLNNSAICM